MTRIDSGDVVPPVEVWPLLDGFFAREMHRQYAVAGAAAALADFSRQADIVILTVPLNDDTEHLFDAGTLALMADGALLVNIARGRVVDTDDLLAELEAHRLRAALDVTDPEPLPADHPLWHAPNVLITAHQGGNTTATYPRTARLVRRQILHLLTGEEPENVIRRP